MIRLLLLLLLLDHHHGSDGITAGLSVRLER
jgi:hypothetical protein